MNTLHNRKSSNQIVCAVFLLLCDLLYLILVSIALISKMELVSNQRMQYSMHVTVIISALVYLLFVRGIYHAENKVNSAKLSLVFSALFTILILIGRFAGIFALSSGDAINSKFNFYGDFSISRNIELVSWTTLFPISVLFLAIVFYKKGKLGTILSGLCFISAICCFIAILCFFSSNIIFLLIGITGWGALFIMIIIMYIIYQVKRENRQR